MLAHLKELMELAVGKRTLKSNKLLSFFAGRILKNRIINNNKPLPRNLGNAKAPVSKGFEAEKNDLIDLINNFELRNLSTEPLGIFGKMSDSEWDNFLMKQFEHHLSQFGV